MPLQVTTSTHFRSLRQHLGTDMLFPCVSSGATKENKWKFTFGYKACTKKEQEMQIIPGSIISLIINRCAVNTVETLSQIWQPWWNQIIPSYFHKQRPFLIWINQCPFSCQVLKILHKLHPDIKTFSLFVLPYPLSRFFFFDLAIWFQIWPLKTLPQLWLHICF